MERKSGTVRVAFLILSYYYSCYNSYMNWATKRKIIYATVIIVLLVVYLLYHYRALISPSPTCFDGVQNGLEEGIDCGGSCSLMCVSSVKPLTLEWSRFIKTQDNTYDLVAYISNKNVNNTAISTPYDLSLINKEGRKIFESRGQVVSPVNTSFPIIIQNVSVTDEPAQITASISQNKHYKTVLNGNDLLISIKSKTLEEGNDISRVYVTAVNNTLNTLNKVKVDVILFDENKNAVGVGETIIDRLLGEEEKQLIFTWNTPFAKHPVIIDVYPIINPFTLNK